MYLTKTFSVSAGLSFARFTKESMSIPMSFKKDSNLLSYGSLVLGLRIANLKIAIDSPSSNDLSNCFLLRLWTTSCCCANYHFYAQLNLNRYWIRTFLMRARRDSNPRQPDFFHVLKVRYSTWLSYGPHITDRLCVALI